jgi:catalase
LPVQFAKFFNSTYIVLDYTKSAMSKKSSTNEPKKAAPSKQAAPAAGGELHQSAGGMHPELTTNQGVTISDNQNSVHCG